jgi:hypothetical protein
VGASQISETLVAVWLEFASICTSGLDYSLAGISVDGRMC